MSWWRSLWTASVSDSAALGKRKHQPKTRSLAAMREASRTHGATVGRLDDTALFYMRSRGINPVEARRLLTYAFAADVLERISRALLLTDVEREHLFLLGLGRPPEVRYRKSDAVTPRLQRVLDALDPHPAVIRTAIWDVVAWNRAATVMLVNYGSLPPEQRNILRFIFLDPRARAAQYDWESVARFVLGSFRVDAARAGAAAEVEPLVDELCKLSPEFKTMWRDNDVRAAHGEAIKHIRHPALGPLAFEYSAFAVDGRTDLTMVVYNPATAEDAERIKSLLP